MQVWGSLKAKKLTKNVLALESSAVCMHQLVRKTTSYITTDIMTSKMSIMRPMKGHL